MNAHEHLLAWAADRGLTIWVDNECCNDDNVKADAAVWATDDLAFILLMNNSVPYGSAWVMAGPGIEPAETVIDYSASLTTCMEEYYARSIA